jgi:type II secretory pathway pseudopilin PulG
MSPCRRSTPTSSITDRRGFSAVELLMGIMLMGLAVTATSGMFLAAKSQMKMQQRQIETTQAARAALDMIVRDLRLSGACLPPTGEFTALAGVDMDQTDTIITRTGLARPNLTCVRSAIPSGAVATRDASDVPVESTQGFVPGMRAYIRHPDGSGEFFDVTSVDSPTELGKAQLLSRDYPALSGVYAVDERRFSIETWSTTHGPQPELLLQIGTKLPQPLAAGIEKLDVHYQLRRNCPACDVVGLPASSDEWALVASIQVALTARSELPDAKGNYYRRTIAVSVKPRNLLPR